MKLTAAPFFWSNIRDRFGEVPAVAAKIPSVILALAIGMVCGLGHDDGTILPRSLAVAPSILDTDLNVLRVVWGHVAFRDSETAIAGFHLDTMITDAKPDNEAKSL